MNALLLPKATTDEDIPSHSFKLTGTCKALAAGGTWRFRLGRRFMAAAGLKAGIRLQLFRCNQGWLLRPSREADSLSYITVDYKQKVLLNAKSLGLGEGSYLTVIALEGGLLLQPTDAPLPQVPTFDYDAFGAFGWRPLTVCALKNREHLRFVDIAGQFLAQTGLKVGDKVEMTVFPDMVMAMQSQTGTINCLDKNPFPGFRLGGRYFEHMDVGGQIVAVFGKGGVAFIGSDSVLEKFNLDQTRKLKISFAEMAKKNFASHYEGREKLEGPEWQMPPSSAQDVANLGAFAWTELAVLESGKVHTHYIDIDGEVGKAVGLEKGSMLELRLFSDQVVLLKSNAGALKCSKNTGTPGVRLKTRYFDWLLKGDKVLTVLGTGGVAIVRSPEDLKRFELTEENRLAA